MCRSAHRVQDGDTAAEERFIYDCAVRYILREYLQVTEDTPCSRHKLERTFESSPESEVVAPEVEHAVVLKWTSKDSPVGLNKHYGY